MAENFDQLDDFDFDMELEAMSDDDETQLDSMDDDDILEEMDRHSANADKRSKRRFRNGMVDSFSDEEHAKYKKKAIVVSIVLSIFTIAFLGLYLAINVSYFELNTVYVLYMIATVLMLASAITMGTATKCFGYKTGESRALVVIEVSNMFIVASGLMNGSQFFSSSTLTVLLLTLCSFGELMMFGEFWVVACRGGRWQAKGYWLVAIALLIAPLGYTASVLLNNDIFGSYMNGSLAVWRNVLFGFIEFFKYVLFIAPLIMLIQQIFYHSFALRANNVDAEVEAEDVEDEVVLDDTADEVAVNEASDDIQLNDEAQEDIVIEEKPKKKAKVAKEPKPKKVKEPKVKKVKEPKTEEVASSDEFDEFADFDNSDDFDVFDDADDGSDEFEF